VKISLRKLNQFDVEDFILWMNDESILALTTGTPEKFSENDLKKCFLKMVNSKNDFHYTILLGEKPIGLVSLIKDRTNNHKMQLVIGDKNCWSKGYDMEAIKQLVEVVKQEGEDVKIYLEVKPESTRSIAAFASYGFVPTKSKRYPSDEHFPKSLKMELS
jgi:RimJ/RimL family protein N-acetyltransferase